MSLKGQTRLITGRLGVLFPQAGQGLALEIPLLHLAEVHSLAVGLRFELGEGVLLVELGLDGPDLEVGMATMSCRPMLWARKRSTARDRVSSILEKASSDSITRKAGACGPRPKWPSAWASTAARIT